MYFYNEEETERNSFAVVTAARFSL